MAPELSNFDCDSSPQQQYSAHNPIEQYVLLAKGAKGAACLELIKQVLEAPGVHVFGELLAMPNIEELQNGPNANYYNTLNLFAYGTYRQYMENEAQLIQLTPAMRKKLQHLTIVSLAIKNKCIPYSELLEELDIKNVRILEDLIIEAIYADVIHGKLDQKNKQLETDYAIGRDIRKGDVTEIVSTLQQWSDSCETILSCLEAQIDRANAEKRKRVKHKEQIEQEIVNLKKAIKTQAVESDEAMAIENSREIAGGPELRKKSSKSKSLKGCGGVKSVSK
ncbi:COP9 signalosome complex subunit 7 [Anopheles aquasalis]|uniref:Cop9 complex subunit 7a n=3 Tax=argyritarsis section TaxID=44545 RepID=W5JIY0_ANODA|nr:COP9 signalosome complex subunit 7-like [Anopheles albimanus]XP_049539255.1 COP9 signalosome complex subunit 7 [Anopheles darlingi]XP_050092931.1 COP9 signalosome complex subunit 7 [Anopheles aquasalis]ETN63248.1 cop9 complex subunit 7a [Anopheles darlingi]